MTFVVIDIETVENDHAKELFQKKTYQAPANYKDPAKIEQAVLEKRQADMDRAALHWWTGKIVCICANVIGLEERPRTFIGADEPELLRQYFDWLSTLQSRCNGLTILGKSSEYFDRPFIIGRALALDLGLPEILRPYRGIQDIDHIFAFSARCDQISNLGDYAFGLGIAGKTMHGSGVAALYTEILMGDHSKWKTLGDYCAQDTDIATEMLRRYLKPYAPRGQAVVPEPEPLDIPFG